MGRTLSILIVDDEELARVRMRDLLAGFEDVECIGEAENGLEAVEKIRELSPDVVILDIQMPGMDGFEVVNAVDEMPIVIFATAYDEYAIKAFEVNSVDYLLKPIERDRLAEAIDRARRLKSGDAGIAQELVKLTELVRTSTMDRLPVSKGKRIVLLDVSDIVWIGVTDELVFAHTEAEKYLVNMTLAELETKLDPRMFFRTHRSSIANLSHVAEIVPWFSGKYKIVMNDAAHTELVLSRARAKSLREIFPW
jgi:DNA-binding LytR/AlgR family response regulator